jgi:hypothetical protein
VGVTSVHPGGIGTNILRNARIRRHINPNMTHDELIAMFDERGVRNTADFAARTIISGIEKNKQRLLIGGDAEILDWMTRLFPVTATRYLSYMMHKYSE